MTNDGHKVYGYIRVSTDLQQSSPDQQREKIAAYVLVRDLGKVDEEFVDLAVSGNKPIGERPGGRELMARVEKGDHVVFSALDRGFRNTGDLCLFLEICKSKDLKIHIIDFYGQMIDLSNPWGLAVLKIISVLSELDRLQIKKRMSDGIKKARKERLIKTGTGVQYGYRVVFDCYEDRPGSFKPKRMWKTVPAYDQFPLLDRIWKMRHEQGINPSAIAEILKAEGVKTPRGGTQWQHSRVMLALEAYPELKRRIEERDARSEQGKVSWENYQRDKRSRADQDAQDAADQAGESNLPGEIRRH